MFSLIIAIIAIALTVAVIAATMYHGGDSLTQGRDKADGAKMVSGAQQIGGAAVMHLSLEGSAAPDVATLVTKKYLASTPPNLALDVAPSRLVLGTAVSDGACTAINKAAGQASGTVVVADLANLPYGCVNTTKAFSYKFRSPALELRADPEQ